MWQTRKFRITRCTAMTQNSSGSREEMHRPWRAQVFCFNLYVAIYSVPYRNSFFDPEYFFSSTAVFLLQYIVDLYIFSKCIWQFAYSFLCRTKLILEWCLIHFDNSITCIGWLELAFPGYWHFHYKAQHIENNRKVLDTNLSSEIRILDIFWIRKA